MWFWHIDCHWEWKNLNVKLFFYFKKIWSQGIITIIIPVVNFTNILAAFKSLSFLPKKYKPEVWEQKEMFLYKKDTHEMLVKLTPLVNFINRLAQDTNVPEHM